MEEPNSAGGEEQLNLDKQRTEIRRAIVAESKLSSPYLIMNSLSTAVASYGLLADSPAVVIGAMIIALLLGPIMGLALALVDGDTSLLRDALLAEAVGAILVIIIAGLIGRQHFDLPVTAEILSRTRPNLLDLAIALFGGAAGAYATVSPRVSVGLVGVAISTALVPPLASCGICLSRGLMQEAGGAFLLFVTNLVAIQCASSVVLYAFGFHQITKRNRDDASYVRRLVVDGLAFLILGVFLYHQLATTIAEQKFKRDLQTRLETGLLGIAGAHLVETRYVEQKDRRVVVAVVRAPNSITPQQTERLQVQLGMKGELPLELHVRSLLTKEATAEGYLHVTQPTAPPVDAPQVQEPASPVPREEEYLPQADPPSTTRQRIVPGTSDYAESGNPRD